MPLIKPEQKYTYEDYLTWDDDERWEIIEGVPYNMSPAPRISHQDVVLNLTKLIGNHLSGKKYRAFISPIDVVFDDENVVQPDFIIVCDTQKITEKCIKGSPDVIFEIISPSSERKDRWIKKRLYERFGVKEYFIIDIDAQYAEHFLLQENGKFNEGNTYGTQDHLTVQTLDNLGLPMHEVFVNVTIKE